MKTISIFMICSTIAACAQPAAHEDELVTANTAFAFDLMNQVTQSKPDANIFISPFSVSSVLQMVENGAKGETKTQIQQALKTAGMSAGSLNAAFKNLDQQFGGRKDVLLNLANGIWFKQGFHLKTAFVDDNQNFFHAELSGVNFDQPQSAQMINQWAVQKTQGKIKDVVQFPFPPLTRLVLANAIYFKGQWVKAFEKRSTAPRDFHLAGGQAKPTPMMTQEGHFQYQQNANFQAVKLPYKGGLQMELYLPATTSNPQKFLADVAKDGQWRTNIQAGFSPHEGTVILPKFKIEYDVRLNDPLKALGMTAGFGDQADFSGMADEPLYIGEVKQKSYVDVNEEGTEAAAVTTVTVRSMAMAMPSSDRFTMILDRPFFFVISDMGTGSILFMGIVNDPAASE